MKIAVVILNWNGQDLLKKFLPSVIKYSKESDIYVVDNNSSDDSVDLLKKDFPEVRTIILKENFGFALGYNKALKQIKADIFCVINSDVEVSENWILPIVKLFKKDKNIGIIQPKILDYKNPNKFEYAGGAGGFIDKLGYPFCRGRVFFDLEEDLGQYDDEKEIFWATGACMFIRSELFLELDGFDTDYIAHQEEIDLCWRAKNRNHKVFYTSKSKVFHVGGASLSPDNPKKTFLNFRNSLFSILKNIPFEKLFFVILKRMILDAFAAIYFVSKGQFKHAWAVFISHLSFYKYFFKIYKKRNSNPLFIKKYYNANHIVLDYFVRKINKFSEISK